MGNRAVLEFENTGIGIYLHWNGGRDTIEPLLAVAKEYQLRNDDCYAPARLIQIIGNFLNYFDQRSSGLSLGVGMVNNLDCDNGDNGTYLISEDLNIVGRKHFSSEEQRYYDFYEMKKAIKKANDKFFIPKEEKKKLPINS